ncbi:MAG: hypothetical protein IT171_02130 [Acidobacteria bacterium]|nr:hypothetical protein [Acidobacteriota bacterium]
MFSSSSNGGFSLKAYQGSQMTLLAMDADAMPQEHLFAGFTLEYTAPGGGRRPIKNLLNFAGTDAVTSSVDSPFQAFKWVHFPSSYSQTAIQAGNWTYHSTPRFFAADGSLTPLDPSRTMNVVIPVDEFSKGGLDVGFTRAFLKSQAYAKRYGAKTRLKPKGDWLFDTSLKAGSMNGNDFSFEDMYIWLGYTARRRIYEILDEALSDSSISVEMFAYDLNDPGTVGRVLDLAKKGRVKLILDDAKLHISTAEKPSREDEFEGKFRAKATASAEIFRCHFSRYAHCKIIILKKNGLPFKVLTGSTNFAITGLCVNANHVLIFNRLDVAKYYSDAFNEAWMIGKAAPFAKTKYSTKRSTFTGQGLPKTEITFSPHDETRANAVLDGITAEIQKASIRSVLFAVMEMGDTSTGSLIHALRQLHKDDSIYTYGVTDNSSGDISLYKPGRKNGLLIDAKKAVRELPPPFVKEASIGLGHAIHHKFVVSNFNRSTARVWCGSSNLALGGEKENSDNLLCIKDQDVATAFAIEAMRLTDHYNFRSVREPNLGQPNQKPKVLDKTGKWIRKFFDPADIRFVERKTLA